MLATSHTQAYRKDLGINNLPVADVVETSVRIREIREGDVPLIREMHERLSGESVYYRYLGSNKPSFEDIHRLSTFNGNDGLVLVAVIHGNPDKVVGIAYYQRDANDSTTAEPAILIEDQYQGCGLGKKMIKELIRLALLNGVETFETFIHSANYRMLKMIKCSGLSFESRYREGLKEVRVWLNPVN